MVRGILVLSLCALPALAQEKGKKTDPLEGNPGISNYYRVRPDVAAAGQPSDEALADIKKAGFKTIINLRTPEEGSLEEKPKVEALGLEYHNIPIGSEGVSKEDFVQFEALIQDSANRPVFIHCAASNRVGALWYIHQVLGEGKDEAAALEEARKAGMKPNLEPGAKDFVAKHRTPK
jgi:uncharacterized protein (TIGR01244 family)